MEQLLEEFDPFTPKSRSVVTSFCPDAEGEFQTGHRSRITTTVPDPDDTTTITIGAQRGAGTREKTFL